MRAALITLTVTALPRLLHAQAALDFQLFEAARSGNASVIARLLERGANKVGSDVLQTLRDFDDQSIASAQLGKLAPEFRLKTANGAEIQLSQFRGKQPVVLVFIYGDT